MRIPGIAILCGIGFIMPHFITNPAFHQGALTADAKIGIFTASLLAGLIGFCLLRRRETEPT